MIAVLGSINVDLVAGVEEIPKVGETLTGKTFHRYFGGKGANQAVALAKLGVETVFLGKVGTDDFGAAVLNSMSADGVCVERVERTDSPTGTALICVDARAQNNIVVIPGANGQVDVPYVEGCRDVIEACDLLLAQHETPIATTEHAFAIAKSLGKTTVLNPAPAHEISDELLCNVDVLVPNEHELSRITGLSTETDEQVKAAADTLIARGMSAVVITLGSRGAMLVDKTGASLFPGHKVKVADTTAAGDSFIGGFVAEYTRSDDMAQAISLGQAVAALSVQKHGAQSSLPTREEVEQFLANHSINFMN